jgi:uncharacterized protein DUF6815
VTGNGCQVGLLWRAEWDRIEPGESIRESCRLHAVFAAFASAGVDAAPVVYSDARVEDVRDQLLGLDGVLVWVNPIEGGLDRSQLDPLLREVAAAGVWVSAHPDVILRIATKRVLVETAAMTWSADVHLYHDLAQLRDELPRRAAERGPIVLKQHRGMGGGGVWKVESLSDMEVRVQHAAGGSASEVMSNDAFFSLCAVYLADGGLMVEQPFQPRLAEGMIRVYLCHDTVVGFAHQYPRGLLDPAIAADLPTEKRFEPPSTERFQALRERLESEWVGELQRLTGVTTGDLPVIWTPTSSTARRTKPVATPMSSARSTRARPSRSRSSPCRPSRRRRSHGSPRAVVSRAPIGGANYLRPDTPVTGGLTRRRYRRSTRERRTETTCREPVHRAE